MSEHGGAPGTVWNFRLYYDQWEFIGGRQQTFADFSFVPQPASEHVIEYIDNPMEAEINFVSLDDFGNRSVLVTSPSTCNRGRSSATVCAR